MVTAAVIRRAGVDDAAALAGFAEQCFRDTFARDNRPEDMESYVAGAFGAELQSADISDPHSAVFIMEVDSQLAGYAHVHRAAMPGRIAASSDIELKRFYITRAWHGRGLAQQLMRRVLDHAVGDGADTVWLAVWERNPRAISFYGKYGFIDAGARPFLLGDDAQTDRIMARAARD